MPWTKEQFAEAQRRCRERKRAAGECYQCGMLKGSSPSKIYCPRCLKMVRERVRRRGGHAMKYADGNGHLDTCCIQSRRAEAARVRMVKHLARHGPCRQRDLARAGGVGDSVVSLMMRTGHPWFQREPRTNLVSLTAAGRRIAGGR